MKFTPFEWVIFSAFCLIVTAGLYLALVAVMI